MRESFSSSTQLLYRACVSSNAYKARSSPRNSRESGICSNTSKALSGLLHIMESAATSMERAEVTSSLHDWHSTEVTKKKEKASKRYLIGSPIFVVVHKGTLFRGDYCTHSMHILQVSYECNGKIACKIRKRKKKNRLLINHHAPVTSKNTKATSSAYTDIPEMQKGSLLYK